MRAFKFNQIYERDQNGATGSVGLEKICEKYDIVNINYGWNLEKEYEQPAERTLCEEVYHAKQFLDGDIGLGLSDDGEFLKLGYDMNDEKEAMDWAGKILNKESVWNDPDVQKAYRTSTNNKREKQSAEQDFILKVGAVYYDNNGRATGYSNKNDYTFRKPKK